MTPADFLSDAELPRPSRGKRVMRDLVLIPQPPERPPAPRRRRVPLLLVTVAAIGAAKAAAWFYFRRRQPAVDGQTRDRLRPRGRA